MKTPRAVLMLSLLALLGLACACPAAGLLGRAETPGLPPLPTRTRAAPTHAPAASAAPSATLAGAIVDPTSALPTTPPVSTQPPAATQPPEEPPGEEEGGEIMLSLQQLTGRYQESWLACDPPMQDWREGLVFELVLNAEDELLVLEMPDTGNEYDPAIYIPGFTLDFFVYGGEAHPDRFLFYTFETFATNQLQGWLVEDGGGTCEIAWTRLP